MLPRTFLYVALVVFTAVAAAYGYRLYQEGQCCEIRIPVVDGHIQETGLA